MTLLDAWWEAARARRLLVQRCEECAQAQHHPRGVCLACGAGADRLTMVEASGRGTVWSFTTVHRAPAPDVAVPYTVALVRLEEGPVLLTHLVHDDARCDEAVSVQWRTGADGMEFPVFGRVEV